MAELQSIITYTYQYVYMLQNKRLQTYINTLYIPFAFNTPLYCNMCTIVQVKINVLLYIVQSFLHLVMQYIRAAVSGLTEKVRRRPLMSQ